MAAANVAANVSSAAEDSAPVEHRPECAHTPRGSSRQALVGASGQAVASWATFAGWRIRMALPKGSRTPMSVP